MNVKHLQPGPGILSFAVVLVGVLAFLRDAHGQESLGAYLCGQADHTFNVDALGYVWGAIGVILFRKLGGKWRRSFIPLVYVCFPADTNEAMIWVSGS